jgi:hypothetical protein
MALDLFDLAQRLKVVDVWAAKNETGWQTPRVLWDPTQGMAPRARPFTRWLDHATVGTNTLRFWGEGGSVNNGTYTLAHYLVPHEQTQYADGHAHDTTNTIFKMVPPGYACNHTGLCAGGINNSNALGMEYENLQNGQEPFSEWQYVKGALVYAHDAVSNNIRDCFRTSHGLVAGEIAEGANGPYWVYGRRTDPYAGPFDFAYSWELVQRIRRDPRIWQLWGLPQPATRAL